jgi:hypothetical protein
VAGAGVWRWETTAAASHETLKKLEQAGLVRSASKLVVRTIVGKWSFPFYGLDLSARDVALDELRQQQADWGPER